MYQGAEGFEVAVITPCPTSFVSGSVSIANVIPKQASSSLSMSGPRLFFSHGIQLTNRIAMPIVWTSNPPAKALLRIR